jgi:hypothetical protein
MRRLHYRTLAPPIARHQANVCIRESVKPERDRRQMHNELNFPACAHASYAGRPRFKSQPTEGFMVLLLQAEDMLRAASFRIFSNSLFTASPVIRHCLV